METNKYFLLIDVGTGSSRVGLAKSNGEIIDIEDVSNEYQEDSFGGTTIEASKFFQRLEEISQKLLNRHKVPISAITVSGARQTFFLVNRAKKLICGIPNIDNRGARFTGDFVNVSNQIMDSTARDISADFLAMKLVGLKHDHPDIFKDAYSFTSLSEVFALIFSNQLVIEPSQAVETQLFDVYDKKWDPKMLEVFELGGLAMPDLVSAGTALIIQNTDALRKYGITNSDCEFIVGGADTQLAMKAITSKTDSKTMYLVSGTTSPVCVRSESPEKYKESWLDLDLGGKAYVLEFNPGVTGLNYERAKRLLAADSSYFSIEETIHLENKPSVMASLTTQSFLPASGSEKKGGIFLSPPLSSSVQSHDLVAAVVYDIGFAISKKVMQLHKDTNRDYETIVACGGGMQSEIIPQIVADLTHKSVVIYKEYAQPSLMGCYTVISESLHGNVEPKTHVVDREYVPQQNETLMHAFEVWNEVGKALN
ncbi:putative sugar kinase YoaC [Lacticaseibacillus paracasei]|uniref:FGGY family carbohydrate kinase n=1 Tax=Lacticaseibacillus paracasei TaxID=1597 RepID=UPI000F0B9E08|nr:FGGY family carbohydrate kinase [Lacticaseibacillus paracasei]RND87018.1 putative sugar kinase YoaC [Lacticaseibacillus paracasei]